MSTAIVGSAPLRLASLIERHFGLALDDTRRSLLVELLGQHPKVRRLGASVYLDELEQLGRASVELARFAAEVTVGETYFFRHAEQLRAFAHVVRTEHGPHRLRALSAGCATGEEAYTLAILAFEAGLAAGAAIDIVGIDLNQRSIERAERAHYADWSLRETTEVAKSRYFQRTARQYALLREEIPPVRFLQGNLLDSPVLEHEAFDVVFCRNVLMYFTPEQAAVVVRRLWTTLKPGGYLFLGHAENLRGLSDDFELRHTHGAFYYERKPTRDAARADSALRREIVPPERAGRPGLEATATDWLGVVDGSTQRIVALSHRALVPSPAQSPAASSTTEVRARVLDLVEKELFHQALQAIDELEESEIDGDLLLVRAAIMTHSGQVILAERACQALLATGRRSAAAHYLLGLLDERRGHDIRSLEHVQAASDLDSSFAMPLLHLGLRAVRSGDGTSARALLGRARDMLEREAPLHLLLFGGGFQRAGLVQMCQAELSRLGGSP